MISVGRELEIFHPTGWSRDGTEQGCHLVEQQKAPTGIKVTTLSPSRTLQYPLHAARADAVPLDQLQVRHTQTAIFEQIVDDLPTQSIKQSPSLCRWRRGGSGTVNLDPVDRLRSQRRSLECSRPAAVTAAVCSSVLPSAACCTGLLVQGWVGGYTRRWLPDLLNAALHTLAWVARVCRRRWGCLRGSPAALPARLSSRVTVWRSRGREYAGLACPSQLPARHARCGERNRLAGRV
jgi:hypothetical protein